MWKHTLRRELLSPFTQEIPRRLFAAALFNDTLSTIQTVAKQTGATKASLNPSTVGSLAACRELLKKNQCSDNQSLGSYLFYPFLAAVASVLLASGSDAFGDGEIDESQIKLHKILECLESIEQKTDLQRIYIPSRNLRLIGQLDEGACGQIWVGELRDGADVETVAVKALSEDVLDNEALAQLIRTEAEVFQRVSVRCHHVCRFYGVSIKCGKLCLIMKYYRRSLWQMMRERGSGLPLADVKKYGTQICKGLAELHEQGIILQDLKPANVLVDDLDNAVLTDFGLASVIDKEGGHVITPSKGTPSYMAPEAWDPKSMGGMSTGTDAWSFACTIIELLTGTAPWSGMEADEICTMVKDQKRRPPLPMGLPKTLSTALEKCFAYHSGSRPDAKDLLQVFLSEWEDSEQRYFTLPPIPAIEAPKLIPAEQSSLYSFDLYPEYVFAIPEVKPLYEVDPGLYRGVVRMQHLIDGI